MNVINKQNEPAKMRFKTLSNGNLSIYLDICQNGRRRYEFLRLYLVPETSAEARAMNANTMRAANAIKAKRVLDIINGKAGIKDKSAGDKITLEDFIRAYNKKRHAKKNGMVSLLYHLKEWKLERVKLSQVDRVFCERLIDKLKGGTLKPNSQRQYIGLFATLMNEAVRAEFIDTNPLRKIDPQKKPKSEPTNRVFLTPDEVQMIINYRGQSEYEDNLRRVFLFACFCGLRISDLIGLRWRNVCDEGGRITIRMKMQKTGREIVLPLTVDACQYLPRRTRYDRDTDPVFYIRENIKGTYRYLLKIAKGAGIDKAITWHTARHTFATMLITFGADIYTVSKLLGHSELTTTQIYAKIVDEKRAKVMDLLDGKFSIDNKEND